ncbi:MAG: hypothetical protein WDO16_12130 [Bacteroidota bacterium]
MSTYIKRISLLFAAAIILFGCKKKVNDFFAPPENLEAPVYQQLEAKGKFTQFLALIDKAGYKQTLSTAGYWTVFALLIQLFKTMQSLPATCKAKALRISALQMPLLPRALFSIFWYLMLLPKINWMITSQILAGYLIQHLKDAPLIILVSIKTLL